MAVIVITKLGTLNPQKKRRQKKLQKNITKKMKEVSKYISKGRKHYYIHEAPFCIEVRSKCEKLVVLQPSPIIANIFRTDSITEDMLKLNWRYYEDKEKLNGN